MTTSSVDFPIFRILQEDGSLCRSIPSLSDDKLREFLQWMLLARTFDQRAFNLQRQGRIGTYAPFSGQEAAQIGSFAVLEKEDWVIPSYRDFAGLMYFGVPLQQALLWSMGHPDAGKMPDHIHVLPNQVIIAAQLLHAVGIAWANKLQGKKGVSVVYFGDGATSQGDFHEALNFASVYKVPTVFFCQNNQYAISMPVAKQMATPTIAQKAVAYGMTGIRVDGNDILAVYSVMKDAVERARKGEGPILIEAITYRLSAHTTADDPTRYRSEQEWEEWKEKRDPILRLRLYLQNQGLWSEEEERESLEEAKQKIDKAVEIAEAYPKAKPSSVFEHVYASAPLQLLEQKREMEERL